MVRQRLTTAAAPSTRAQSRHDKRRHVVAVIVISDLEFGGAQRQVVELANRLEAENVTAYVCSLSQYVPLSKYLSTEGRLRVMPRRVRFDATVVLRLAWF